MEIIIKKPAEVSQSEMNQIAGLIDQGSQIDGDRAAITSRIRNAVLVAFILDQGRIVSTATLKNPTERYREKVFASAKTQDIMPDYQYELGYIVTAADREGEKLCQKLLTEFYPAIAGHKIFATTRKEAMIRILGKFGFKTAGDKYNEDLSLLVN